MIRVQLIGGNGQQVGVSNAGELLIAPGPYDLTEYKALDVINTAYNFYKPLDHLNFVLTGIIMYGDKQVGTSTNATVIIYESSAEDSIVVDKTLIQVEVGQNQSIPFPTMRVLVEQGAYVNAKTDDDDVHVTLFGHYVDLRT